MEEINDLFILKYFYNSDGTKINAWKLKHDIPIDILTYLNNRFTDSESNKETIIRIKHAIYEKPKCKVCGKNYTKFICANNLIYANCCCNKCEKEYRRIKTTEAIKEKYGVDNISKLEEIKKKKKDTFNRNYPKGSDAYKNLREKEANSFNKTCINRYGGHPMQNAEICQKMVDTTKSNTFNKYGVEYYFLTQEFKDKLRKHSLETYGVEHLSLAIENRQKNSNALKTYGLLHIKETCLKRYGSEYWALSLAGHEKLSSFEVLEKQYNTKKSRNSYSKSKQENIIYELFKEHFPDIIHGYFSNEYPFNCDFYIPSILTYIEYLGTWMHGGHPFDELNPDDVRIVNKWSNKSNEISFNGNKKVAYKQAIYVWTISDVKKRKIAKDRNLKYIELWNINDAKQFIDSFIK